MKKLIMGLGLSAIVGFSAAASAGQCTMAKLQGNYVMSVEFTNKANTALGHTTERLRLNKNGTGKVTAYLEAVNGYVDGAYVTVPLKWNVQPDCTGAIEFEWVDGTSFAYFVVSGNPQQPIMDGVYSFANGNESGAMQLKKIRF